MDRIFEKALRHSAIAQAQLTKIIWGFAKRIGDDIIAAITSGNTSGVLKRAMGHDTKSNIVLRYNVANAVNRARVTDPFGDVLTWDMFQKRYGNVHDGFRVAVKQLIEALTMCDVAWSGESVLITPRALSDPAAEAQVDPAAEPGPRTQIWGQAIQSPAGFGAYANGPNTPNPYAKGPNTPNPYANGPNTPNPYGPARCAACVAHHDDAGQANHLFWYMCSVAALFLLALSPLT